MREQAYAEKRHARYMLCSSGAGKDIYPEKKVRAAGAGKKMRFTARCIMSALTARRKRKAVRG